VDPSAARTSADPTLPARVEDVPSADTDMAPRRASLTAAALPAAIIVFLVLAFVIIGWTLVAAGASGSPPS
jgi:hypothetical protein